MLLIAGSAQAQIEKAIQEINQISELRKNSGTRLSGVLHALAAKEIIKKGRPMPANVHPREVAMLQEDLLLSNEQGKIAVQIRVEQISRIMPELFVRGFELSATSEKYSLVEGWIHPGNLLQLEQLAAYGLLSATPIYRPFNNAGSVTSEADIAMRADRARAIGNVDGTGIKIGILSDSYDVLGGESAGIASGDLPTEGVNILQEGPAGTSDEGRAMAELIHDLAPGADLYFATAFGGELTFANNIQALADAGCKVIVDDIGYFTEPFFQDGIIAQAVDEVTQNQGVTYFSAAGNLSNQAYESTSNITFSTIFTPFGFLDAYDFGQGACNYLQSYTLAPGQRLVLSLQWDDPFFTLNGTDTNLDILLLDSQFGILTGAIDNNIAIQRLVEVTGFVNETTITQTVFVLIFKSAGPNPGRIKMVNFGSNVRPNQFDTFSPTMNPHGGAKGGIALGAAPYFNQRVPESFTSQGPHTVLFSPNGTPLGAPEVRLKPDLTAIDNTNTTFFGVNLGEDAFPNFAGTSAAAPHAAAVAALILQKNPTFTRDQVYAALTNTAIDLFTPGFDNITGFGLIDAYQAVLGDAFIAQALDINEGFENGSIGAGWDLKSTANGRILITNANTPGNFHLTMDNFFSSNVEFSGLNEAILHFDATGFSQITLRFDQKEFGDEDNSMPATFSGSTNADGVALSVDGQNWFRLIDLTGANSTGDYQTNTFDLVQFASDNGLTLGDKVRIKFQQFDNFPIPSDGFAFDNIEVKGLSQKPVAVCKNISIPLKADGTVSITANDVDGGSSDDVGIVSKTIDLNNFTCAQVGQNTVTLTVQDADGQTASCTATVTVNDTENPTITCPANISETVAFGEEGKVITYNAPTFGDNCEGAVIQLTAGLESGATFPVGITTVTYQVSDAAGNTDECSFTVSITAEPPVTPEVIFTLVNAQTDVDLLTLSEGQSLDLSSLPTNFLSIRADLANPVGSVRMVLSGPLNHTQTESLLPYALFGDNPTGNYNGRNFVPGDYTLTVTPYSGPKLADTPGVPFVLNFTLTLPAPALTALNLIDALNDVVIGPLSDGQVLNSADFSNLFFSVEALGNAQVGSVYFELSGPLNRTATENLPPYALYGDANGGTNYLGANFLSGNYTLRATPYAGDNRSGAQGTPIEISFTLNVPNAPTLLSATLVNAQTDLDIRTMVMNDVLDVSQLGAALSIRANANGSLTESVRFVLKKDGQTIINRIENIEPYALLGDNPTGNYNNWTPANGQYELILTPYAGNNATGLVGADLVLPFEVINAPVSRAVAQAQYPDEVSESGQVEWRKSYPNPLTGSVLEVEMSEALQGEAVWELSDAQGRVLYRGSQEAEGRQQLRIEVLKGQLPQGIYFLHLRAANLPHTVRRIVKAN
ncbi:MAG: hypothetical protein OHK0053_18300 [Microscillaceae bacterium]